MTRDGQTFQNAARFIVGGCNPRNNGFIQRFSFRSVHSGGHSLASKSSNEVKKRIMFFGTNSFSLATLKLLHQAMFNNEVVSHLEVCTAEANHIIRSVQNFCLDNSLPLHHWPPDTEAMAGRFDIGVVASFGKLLTSKIIHCFPMGVLNVHGSLLPRWRGASPIPHAIMSGDSETGISIMEVLPYHFDIGKVLAQQSVKIHADQTRVELTDEMAAVGANLMLDVLRDLNHYKSKAVSQDESLVTYAHKIDKSMSNINWREETARQIYNKWRALNGIYKLSSTWEDSGVTVRFDEPENPDRLSDRRVESWCEVKGEEDKDFSPGRAIFVKHGKKRHLCIKCCKDWISFSRIFYGHQRVMTPLDFYNGFMSRNRHRSQFFQ